jgi:hypothetical protein
MISEDEGDYTRANRLPRPHSYILEEDETEEVEAEVAHARGIDYHGDRLILTPKKGRPPLWWIPSWACLCEMSLTCQQPLLVRTINTADDDQGHMSDVSLSYCQFTPYIDHLVALRVISHPARACAGAYSGAHKTQLHPLLDGVSASATAPRCAPARAYPPIDPHIGRRPPNARFGHC